MNHYFLPEALTYGLSLILGFALFTSILVRDFVVSAIIVTLEIPSKDGC
ncbi:MAG: hypothetical protein QMC62_13955 [Alteromonadaceae bacterium]